MIVELRAPHRAKGVLANTFGNRALKDFVLEKPTKDRGSQNLFANKFAR